MSSAASELQNDVNLIQFHRGWALDAQVLYGGSQDYANYVYGVYTSAAGMTLDQALEGAEIYAELKAKYPAGTKMNSKYTHVPQVNVDSITSGYNAQLDGTMCSVSGG